MLIYITSIRIICCFIKMTITPGTNNQDVTPLREQIITTDSSDTAAINIIMVAETII